MGRRVVWGESGTLITTLTPTTTATMSASAPSTSSTPASAIDFSSTSRRGVVGTTPRTPPPSAEGDALPKSGAPVVRVAGASVGAAAPITPATSKRVRAEEEGETKTKRSRTDGPQAAAEDAESDTTEGDIPREEEEVPRKVKKAAPKKKGSKGGARGGTPIDEEKKKIREEIKNDTDSAKRVFSYTVPDFLRMSTHDSPDGKRIKGFLRTFPPHKWEQLLKSASAEDKHTVDLSQHYIRISALGTFAAKEQLGGLRPPYPPGISITAEDRKYMEELRAEKEANKRGGNTKAGGSRPPASTAPPSSTSTSEGGAAKAGGSHPPSRAGGAFHDCRDLTKLYRESLRPDLFGGPVVPRNSEGKAGATTTIATLEAQHKELNDAMEAKISKGITPPIPEQVKVYTALHTLCKAAGKDLPIFVMRGGVPPPEGAAPPSTPASPKENKESKGEKKKEEVASAPVKADNIPSLESPAPAPSPPSEDTVPLPDSLMSL